MITFQHYKNGLYLSAADIAAPGNARVGFMFQDQGRQDPTFTFSAKAWTDKSDLGYFAFFAPSSTRDWDAFATAIRGQFQSHSNAQFGWFEESGGTVTPAPLIIVSNQGSGQAQVQSSFSYVFRNVALQVTVNPFGSPNLIAFDDASNVFAIDNPSVGGQAAVRIVVQVPNGTSQTYFSNSSSLTLPLAGPHQGSVHVDFQLDVEALKQFEAGLMYFSPPSGPGQPINAFNYPLIRAPGGAAVSLSFSAWLDVLEPLADTRTFFQFSDPVIGSYFASGNGRPFALHTTNGSDLSKSSRLVFANRPVSTISDASNFYLTPAGQFGLGIDGDPSATAPAQSSARLLCGVTGTEFLHAQVGDTPDALLFVPAQPAYRIPPPKNQPPGDNPVYLDSVGGSATTSWVQFLTTAGTYVSQPQRSPLYQQGQNTTTLVAGEAAPSGVSVYTLDFLPLPTWTAPAAASAGVASSPPVPMVPYSGIPFATDPNLDLELFLDMETAALNPTRKFAFINAQAPAHVEAAAMVAAEPLTYAMTPQGLLAGLAGTPPVWSQLQIATSPAGTLQLVDMGREIRQALQQNQIFAVISTTSGATGVKLFGFDGADQSLLEIADWAFNLSPQGTPSDDGTPPILILKFYHGKSIAQLVDNAHLWTYPATFQPPDFDATKAQAYLQGMIQEACQAIYGTGTCTNGTPDDGPTPDKDSLYYDFYTAVTDPEFTGVLAVNCNIQLNSLPPAIRAVLGGMTKPSGDGGPPVSNIGAFRAHHVGVRINDTDPQASTPTLAQSSLFGLVDYQKPAETAAADVESGVQVDYNFEVEYLRALFTNSELRNFSCQINLTINNLFDTDVKMEGSHGSTALAAAQESGDGGDSSNVVKIIGSYQAHSTSGDQATSGQGVYSFIAEGDFTFTFKDTPYLDKITLTKLQFSFQEETPVQGGGNGGATSHIRSRFAIWGSMVFKELQILDIFSFKKLAFADLGIDVSYDLTTFPPPQEPATANLHLGFSPGDLRLDLGETTKREGPSSLLDLIPFKLKSFLYSQHADQTLESLKYFALSSVPGLSSVKDTFNYGLIFDLDLGSMGGLVGSLSAFKFSILVGWLSGPDGGIAFGIQLPEADGKLEIKIEGVLSLVIQEFQLKYATIKSADGKGEDQQIFVLVLYHTSLEILGTRLPPGTAVFDFALFAPTQGSDEIGWIAAYNNTSGGGEGGEGEETLLLAAPGEEGEGGGEDEGGDDKGGVFDLIYLGGGQRVGPDPASPPTNFKDFLDFMTSEFLKAVKDNDYAAVYHPDSKWLVIVDFRLMKIIEVGLIFYDATPFYSLMLNVEKLFNFEITYTKISDTIGLFYANLTVPDNLRTFEVGAASLTLPAIGVSVYTNGNWKVDAGFPKGDDWSRSFRVEAMAGPIPVTGAGGFYLASLSSATSDIFEGTYASILAFGFAARLGVGKDFTAGPLKAGVSVTFFGIIEGAAGYLVSSSTEIFKKPDALMLKGEFGVIGEIYGSIDFVIIKASVNVRLEASVGVQLMLEPTVPGRDGSILLYIQASVELSVRVSINLGLFSIHISLSFKTSVRFQWHLGDGSSAATAEAFVARAVALRLVAPQPLTLCPGLRHDLPIWFMPELTVVFPDTTQAGEPWLVASLGLEFDPKPPAKPAAADLKPFETVTAQMVTWALSHVLKLSDCSSTVPQAKVKALDEHPEHLVGWIDYPSLLAQLQNFQATIYTPSTDTENDRNEAHATVFPMLPFLRLQTEGRLDGSGKADDLDYTFAEKNPVDRAYLDELQAYFDQLFVNQAGASAGSGFSAYAAAEPLVQWIFVDYFTGLIRGAVHQLLGTMEDDQLDEANLDELILKAVGKGRFATLAAQTSSTFRGGARLPFLQGMTVPGGAPQATTNPLYALLWQEFPVGGLGKDYSIALSNPDSSQAWVKSTATYALDAAVVGPYQNLPAGSVTLPSAPVQQPYTNSGPQSFSLQNATIWTPAGEQPSSLRQFPPNLNRLQKSVEGPIAALVQSRDTGAAYLPGGTPLDPTSFTWATRVELTVKQVPSGTGGRMLPDIYSLGGASQEDQALLEQILRALQGDNPIASIQVLYQKEAGAKGLNSAQVKPEDVFVLRTNTTTVSAPPAAANLQFMAMVAEPQVTVGARIDEFSPFLQIVQQATVTNAPGYYLRYKDAAGSSLPAELFRGGPAPVTLLITYAPDKSANTSQSPASIRPYYNALVLADAKPGLLYYAATTDRALYIQHSAAAAGTVGLEMTRHDSAMALQPPQGMAEAFGLATDQPITHHQLTRALYEAGVREPEELHAILAEANAAPAQLNALYSQITYQVKAGTGFVQSNFSAPIPLQKPDGAPDDGLRRFRLATPLYKLAVANQSLGPDDLANRYASLNDSFEVDFWLTDAFGNQLPAPLSFQGTNLYFDPIVPVDQWQGVVLEYDFLVEGKPKANSFTVRLMPGKSAFEGMTIDQAAAALVHYQTILHQITGPGVSFCVETNLALNADESMVKVALSDDDVASITGMVNDIVKYLKSVQDAGTPSFDVQAVPVAVTASGAGTLPPLFEIAVLLGIERDPALISPLLKDASGNITFPSAQSMTCTVTPAMGVSVPPEPPVSPTTFAANFVQAFPALVLSIGLNDAHAPQRKSGAGLARAQLKALGIPSDGTGDGRQGPQSLWAVQQALLDIEIGQNKSTGPRYASPKPLDNTLNTQLVPLPTLPAPLPQLPQQMLFVDVDPDRLNRSFFAAVDDFLAPAAAGQAFELQRSAYNDVANGRMNLAEKYAQNEVDWLFPSAAPFTGSGEQLQVAREAFGQQMRAALMTAYAVDTVIQYDIKWNSPVPAAADDRIALFGQVLPVTGQKPQDSGFGLSTAKVAASSSGQGLLTFLFGTSDIQDAAEMTLDLEFSVSHVEYYLEPANETPPGEARPSIWLQLIDPYPAGPPHVGPPGTPTVIPLVFRQYPTPPTVVSQSGSGEPESQAASDAAASPLVAAAAWRYVYSYQAQLTAHDRILSRITYNTNLRTTSNGTKAAQAFALDETQFTLFEALARFSAAYPLLRPVLQNPCDPNWAAAAQAFASLVTEVVNNSDWNPVGSLALMEQLVHITDRYAITDDAQEGQDGRLISLMWDAAQGESSFQDVNLSILALAPNRQPYPRQTPGKAENGISDAYVPDPPLFNDWVTHQVTVDALNVLTAENALAGVQVERNLIRMEAADGNTYEVQQEYVYKTPLVRPSQPVTPFVQNDTAIDVAQLPPPSQPASACGQSASSLCSRIYTMMANLLAHEEQVSKLLAAKQSAGLVDTGAVRRVKVGSSFQYPLPALTGGVAGSHAITPAIPVVLARSFEVDATQLDQLGDFAHLYAQAIADWAKQEEVTFGTQSQPAGAQLVFDITLYAQLSGLNTPVLRLSNLQLKLTDIDSDNQ